MRTIPVQGFVYSSRLWDDDDDDDGDDGVLLPYRTSTVLEHRVA